MTTNDPLYIPNYTKVIIKLFNSHVYKPHLLITVDVQRDLHLKFTDEAEEEAVL